MDDRSNDNSCLLQCFQQYINLKSFNNQSYIHVSLGSSWCNILVFYDQFYQLVAQSLMTIATNVCT